MHGVYELKEMLCDELEEYGKKGELSAGSLDIVDKLAHTIKNINKILDHYEEESDGSYYDGMRYEDGRYIDRGKMSYARGRSMRRDSRGRYSSEGYSRTGDMVDKLRDLMHEAPDEHTKQEIQRLVNKMEQM